MKHLKIVTFGAAAALLAIGFSGATLAADGAELYKTKTCWSCHGKDAKTPIMPMYPKLAGQTAEYAFNQMKDIKSGARNNGQTAAMKGVMGLVSEEEMKAIAEWLSTQPK
jgi:cytochrome c